MYEYRCPHCGERFEKLRKFSEADQPLACPHCGAEDTERQLSTFATNTGCGPNGGGRFT